jgi:hypothetical protein
MSPSAPKATAVKAEANGAGHLLQPGTRVSLELPESGTCVAIVRNADADEVGLRLLDELPSDGIAVGTTLELFMPRPAGIFHWLCALRGFSAEEATLQLLSEPLFVQRRLAYRWEEAGLNAGARRVRAARRGALRQMRVADVSRGGLKLEGPMRVSTGDTLEVTMDLGLSVQLVGRAVMAYPTSEGNWAVHVSFLDGQREAIDALDGYIARRTQSDSH